MGGSCRAPCGHTTLNATRRKAQHTPQLRHGGHALQSGLQRWRAAQHVGKHAAVLGLIAGLHVAGCEGWREAGQVTGCRLLVWI